MGKTDTRGHRRLTRAVLMVVLACGALLGAMTAAATAAVPPIKHVFVLVLENESEATSFGPSSPAPYLAKTLVSAGAYVPNYYGIGHSSLDNYIAMVSGQAPNSKTSADCFTFSDFPSPTSLDASGQETGQGCVYPANVPTLMGQLQAKGLRWRGYMEDMGANPLRDNPGAPTTPTCGHPAVNGPDVTQFASPTDQYAARHDPFVYFHSVIDNPSLCNANVVNLNRLPSDLASAASTPNFVFITPNLCNDGHDASCANGGPGGLTAANTFLQTWVPRITASPAFKQDGLLIVTFDEGVGDASACCGEKPGPGEANPGGSGPGGGKVGAVLLSRYIKAGTTASGSYNHYSMLGSVEDTFGLSRLAAAVGPAAFGADVFTNPSGLPPSPTPTPTPKPKPKPAPPQITHLTLKPTRFSHRHPGTSIRYTVSEAASTKLTISARLPGYRRSARVACRALATGRRRPAHSRACTVVRALVRLSHADRAGANRVAFSGRVHHRALAKGHYQVAVVPRSGGRTGRSATARFTVT